MSLLSYIGTKKINAAPLTRQEYNDLRGWELPADENGDDEGYLVEYIDSPSNNVEGFAGYVSWSPKDVFERAYRVVDGMSFGLAVEALKMGERVARAGWNGKGMFLLLVNGTDNAQLREGTPYHSALNTDRTGQSHVSINPHIDMMTATGEFQPGWLASQTDMLADDWMIVT
jgi:hypothetical protein